jgi:rhodanese-related sulfurtransferase
MVASKRNLWQMAAMAAASLALGLAVNFFSAAPLPLLRPLERSRGAAPVVFGEIDADFVRQLGSAPGTLVLDARAAAAYRAGHIPGALSLPLGEFAAVFPALAPRLRRAKMLFVYCSGPSCNDSRDLAGRLWGQELKSILVYTGGMEDWTGRGHAVAR